MLPLELDPITLTFPPAERPSIVIVTGNQLRHKRFAYRIQQAFGEQVAAWYELGEGTAPAAPGVGWRQQARMALVWVKALRRGCERVRAVRGQAAVQRYFAAQARVEAEIFGPEIQVLSRFATVTPRSLPPGRVQTPEFAAELAALSPYFFLTLGGPLYPQAVLAAVRGAAINQHAGHSPDLRGSNTTEWALYHRDLERVSATVHLTTSGADAGPILRRSNPCLFPADSINHVFARVVALGTELMIECVTEIMQKGAIQAFPQAAGAGRTYLGKELEQIILSIQRDFRSGWLAQELNRQRGY